MQIVIKSTGLELNDSLKSYVENKFASIEKLVKSFESNGELILKVEIARTTRHHNKGDVFYVESLIAIGNKTLRIEQNDEDMHSAIDLAQSRLKHEVEQFKERAMEKDRKSIDKLKQKD